eukprot:1769510-Amphidinium_carterae.1
MHLQNIERQMCPTQVEFKRSRSILSDTEDKKEAHCKARHCRGGRCKQGKTTWVLLREEAWQHVSATSLPKHRTRLIR